MTTMVGNMTSTMGGRVKSIIFAFLWFFSILLSVIYIYTPLIFILPFSRRWFRKCTDIIYAIWELYPAALLEIFIGCKVVLSGDTIDPLQGGIIIMNHRNRLDWFFLWSGLLHATKPPAHRCKFVLKSDVKRIPGIGWGLQMAGFLYIYRQWTRDKVLLQDSLDYFRDIDNKYQILIFPEVKYINSGSIPINFGIKKGTDLSDWARERSNTFAEKNGLPKYEYVLHPRTTGFTFILDRMRQNKQIEAVYDLTIAYPKTLPLGELDILLHGKIPEEVHFNIKKYDVSDLPKDEEGAKVWCEKRWVEKEESLRKFYTGKEKRFSPDSKCETHWNALHLALWVWSLLTLYFIYLFWTSPLAFWWAIIVTITHVLIAIYSDGIQQFEIRLFRLLEKPLNNKID